MKNILLINTISLFFMTTNAQTNKTLMQYEDTLKIIAKSIMNAENEEKKQDANKIFTEYLTNALKQKKSFKFPFDSLISISRLRSPDNSFRLFNWILKKDNGTYEYYAIIHYYNKQTKKYNIIQLKDNSDNIHNPEQEKLNAERWYGCLYYKIIYIKQAGRKFYTMLGWDGNNIYSTKKIIDVMYFSKENKINFGLPIFKNNNQSKKRIILEYNSNTSVSLKYHAKEERIVFNNLIPSNKGLEGLQEYYTPDGTFNHYKYKDKKWWFKQNIDARNNTKIKKPRKRPKKGLIPN